MTSVHKKRALLTCVLLAAVSTGCETTDYGPLMEKKINDLEAEVEGLESEVARLKSTGAQGAAETTVESEGDSDSEEVPSTPKLSAEDEKAIRDSLENSDAFFIVNESGFAIEADLAECRIGNDAISQLAEFSALTKIVLDGTRTDSETYDELAKIENLEHLDIARSSPDVAAFEKLKGLKKLKFLQLLKATLPEDAMKVLSEFPALEQIRCGQTRVGDTELQHLANLKTLKAIDLSDCNRVTIKGIEALSKCPKLSFLKVWGDTIDNDCMPFVAKMKSLRVLGLNDTNVTDEGIKQLAELDLREIHLFRTSIGDESLRVISQMPNVVTLNLRDTRISDQGIEYLTNLKNLRKLDLSECNSPGITDVSGAHFAKLANLNQLNLWSTKITDAALQPVSQLKNLTWLNLDNTQVTDEGVTILEQMPQLTWLHLGKTKITDVAATGLMKLVNLKYLNVSYTKLTEDVAYDLDDFFTPNGGVVILP